MHPSSPLLVSHFLFFLYIASNPFLLFLLPFLHSQLLHLFLLSIFSPSAIPSFSSLEPLHRSFLYLPPFAVPPCTNTGVVPPLPSSITLVTSSALSCPSLPLLTLHHKTLCPQFLPQLAPSRPQFIPAFHRHFHGHTTFSTFFTYSHSVVLHSLRSLLSIVHFHGHSTPS